MDATLFAKLLPLCHEVGRMYEPGLIYIGGIAVYLHAANTEGVSELSEATQDADFYISVAGFSDLREIEELTANSLQSKHEFRKRDFSFDVYTERHSKLPVPYANVAACALSYDGVLVAAPEHLIVLKLEAAINRRESEHGRKDVKDIIRLLLVAAQMEKTGKAFDADLACAFMQQGHFDMLGEILKGPEFLALALGNAKTAKSMRAICAAVMNKIEKAFGAEAP